MLSESSTLQALSSSAHRFKNQNRSDNSQASTANARASASVSNPRASRDSFSPRQAQSLSAVSLPRFSGLEESGKGAPRRAVNRPKAAPNAFGKLYHQLLNWLKNGWYAIADRFIGPTSPKAVNTAFNKQLNALAPAAESFQKASDALQQVLQEKDLPMEAPAVKPLLDTQVKAVNKGKAAWSELDAIIAKQQKSGNPISPAQRKIINAVDGLREYKTFGDAPAQTIRELIYSQNLFQASAARLAPKLEASREKIAGLAAELLQDIQTQIPAIELTASAAFPKALDGKLSALLDAGAALQPDADALQNASRTHLHSLKTALPAQIDESMFEQRFQPVTHDRQTQTEMTKTELMRIAASTLTPAAKVRDFSKVFQGRILGRPHVQTFFANTTKLAQTNSGANAPAGRANYSRLSEFGTIMGANVAGNVIAQGIGHAFGFDEHKVKSDDKADAKGEDDGVDGTDASDNESDAGASDKATSGSEAGDVDERDDDMDDADDSDSDYDSGGDDSGDGGGFFHDLFNGSGDIDAD